MEAARGLVQSSYTRGAWIPEAWITVVTSTSHLRAVPKNACFVLSSFQTLMLSAGSAPADRQVGLRADALSSGVRPMADALKEAASKKLEGFSQDVKVRLVPKRRRRRPA